MKDRGEEAVDRDLEAMASRPEVARQVKESLRRMRTGETGPEMAEMARDLLEGRIHIRDPAATEVYSGGLVAGIERYQRWESTLTSEGRQKFNEHVQELRGSNNDPRA